MVTRRIASAAVLLVLFGAGCADHRSANVAAVADVAAVVPAAAIVESTTTTTPPAAAEPAAAPTPVVSAKPAPATIEVDYQPQNGATATATITGPNGSHSKSLDSGAAIFSGLPNGAYAVTITIDTPSDNPNIGDARLVLNGGDVQVAAGEHGLVVCDDNGCQGAS